MNGLLLRCPASGWAKQSFKRLYPGGHAVVIGRYQDALEAEDAGFEVRDCLTAIGMTVQRIWLFRRPLDRCSIVTQVLRTGTGGIWLDGCRTDSGGVHGSANSVGQGRGYKDTVGHGRFGKNMGGIVAPPHPKGRWPTNLVFVHRPGCKPNAKAPTSAWDCEPNCPIVVLDQQSGISTSSNDPLRFKGTVKFKNGSYVKDNDIAAATIKNDMATAYGDTGGASRFFPQFVNDVALDAWLLRLVCGEGEGP